MQEKKIYSLLFALLMMIFISNNHIVKADNIDDVLKADFSNQQRILIKNEVYQRFYSMQAGHFKLKKIASNRTKINQTIEKILPWAIMEGLEPRQVARIIVYLFHAQDAGQSFLDAEDLIPLVAKKDIKLTDFILMVQYVKETKKAGIPQAISESFIGDAFKKNWDGLSILAGGRGLLIAKKYGYNINKAATYLLDNLPRKSARSSAERIANRTISYLGNSYDKNITGKLIVNYKKIHRIIKIKSPSPAQLRAITKIASEINFTTKKIAKIIIPKVPKKNKKIDPKKNIIPVVPDTPKPIVKPGDLHWTILSVQKLKAAIGYWLGTRYLYGGRTKRGIDCSNFTRKVLLDKKVRVPGSKVGYGTRNQKNNGKHVNKKNLRAGDLIFFSASPQRSKITHVGIMSSKDQFAHASCSRGVTYDKLSKKWWNTRYVRGRRFFVKVVK